MIVAKAEAVVGEVYHAQKAPPVLRVANHHRSAEEVCYAQTAAPVLRIANHYRSAEAY